MQTMNSESARRYYGSYKGGSSAGIRADLLSSGLRAERAPEMPDAGEDVSSFGEMIYTVGVTIDYRVEGK